MIHHVSVGTNDLGAAKRFYDAVLPIVGILPLSAAADGLRPAYDAHYYGAFVHDPDGHKIEAVTHSAA